MLCKVKIIKNKKNLPFDLINKILSTKPPVTWLGIINFLNSRIIQKDIKRKTFKHR